MCSDESVRASQNSRLPVGLDTANDRGTPPTVARMMHDLEQVTFARPTLPTKGCEHLQQNLPRLAAAFVAASERSGCTVVFLFMARRAA